MLTNNRKSSGEKYVEVNEVDSLYFKYALDVMVIVGFDGCFKQANPAFERILGWKEEEVISKPFAAFVHPDDRQKSIIKAASHQTGEEAIRFENRYLCKDGTYKTISWNSHPLPQQQIVIEIGRDIPERKKAEKVLKRVEEQTKQLRLSERIATISSMAGMVGHDIRNPLQAIVNNIFYARYEIRSKPETESVLNMLEVLDEIENNVFYINKIVADLQDYAKPLKPTARTIKIRPLLEESLQSTHVPKNIQTFYYIDEDANTIFTDLDLLKRILNNLSMNAIQAMPDGGKVFVKVTRNNEDTIISIEDTGAGISDDVKPKLFTPMFTTKCKGQGLGLAVVKRLTDVLGGTIIFESQVGKGAKFILSLPPFKEQKLT